ncbi:MAG: carbohydrate binding family 9 domain-containing protein [Gemmatimonadota bacterium]|nr:carbohydrate binding family 9 domain-containing protein [Gemmatimonadota bacterium]
MRTGLALLLTLLIPAGALGAQQTTYHGRAGTLAAAPPRLLDMPVTVDGVLDEPVWQRAAILTGFSQYRPVDGRPAEDSTEVLVWYAPDAIHFGIRAFEPHGQVRATLADRDKIDTDDNVQILLDTFDDRRRAYVFSVNPLGVQADGIRTEGSGGAAGGPGAGGRFENVDMNPDFTFESHGRLTPWGYEVEIRIPFKSIRFPGADPQRWSINVIRKTQHSAYEDTWTPAVRANASFLAQSGTLEGLSGLRRGLVLSVNPFATGRLAGAPDSLGDWTYDATPEAGVNVSWGITTNLTLDGTANPDFSQVEADVAQITVNERFALFFPEKRPFFLEGIELFNTPNSLIYTRRIREPLGGVKLTGKLAGTSVALLSAVDARGASATGDRHPVINALRVRRDVGAQSTVGLTYTDRIEGSDYNRLASADVRLVFARLYFFEIQGAASRTREAGVTATAPLWEVTVDRTGRSWGFNYRIRGIHEDFRADAGFVPRSGIVEPFIANRLSAYGRPGAFLETWTGFFALTGVWNYREFFDGGSILESDVGHTSFFTVRGGWGATVRPNWQTVRFDPAFYGEYFVDTGADTVPLGLPDRLTDLWSLGLSVSTPQFPTIAASVGASLGTVPAFFEPAPARTASYNTTVTWRPTEKVRVEARYVYSRLNRERDGTRLSTAHIPRLKFEYQLSRAVFVRFIGQYTAQERDALRDPATDQPILIAENGGTFRAATPGVQNDVRMDWLFSFRPTPGTVAYAGYGTSLTEDDAFTFRDLRRVSDGFFLKLSYLFQL